MRLLTRSHIIGVGMTALGRSGQSASALMRAAVNNALADAGVTLQQVDGLIAVPSLAEPHFMEAHYVATLMGLLPKTNVIVRTIDTGGAGPVSGLIQADFMIRHAGCDLVVVVAGDSVQSLDSAEFLKRADASCSSPDQQLPSPVIPNGYDRVARWHMQKYGLTRDQLAMVSVLMSRQAQHHPAALTRHPHTLAQVLAAPPVAPVTGILECARRSDGGAAVLLASTRFLTAHGLLDKTCPVVISGAEASGPLFPPAEISESMFSCDDAAKAAYALAHLGPSDIDFFGLYDCFPICFIRAVEAVGLAAPGGGGRWVQEQYHKSEAALAAGKERPRRDFPVNTHGGLLAFGAPWEVPAMYNIIEAVAQLRGSAHGRQIPDARRALVYGNGGIFSSSAVAILGSGNYSRVDRG